MLPLVNTHVIPDEETGRRTLKVNVNISPTATVRLVNGVIRTGFPEKERRRDSQIATNYTLPNTVRLTPR